MRLNKSTTTKVALQLSQVSNNDSEWVIKITDVLSNESKVLVVEDISEHADRANIFEIIENDNEDLSNGVISLSEGQYDYLVYEMAPASPRTTDPDLAIQTVAEGILIVYNAVVPEDNSFSDDEPTHGVFNG